MVNKMAINGNEIIEIRDFLVEQLRYISLQEWRLLGFYLCKINPRDISTRYVRVDLEDYLKILDLDDDTNISYLKASTKKLLQIVIDGPDPDKNCVYAQTTLFQRCRLKTDEHGKYYFDLNAADDALPLMFDFQKKYIKAKGMNIFALSSPKQILMYLFMRNQYDIGRKNFEVSLDELRKWLGIKPEEYQRFQNFNDWVLKSCEKALKENSDLCFTYEKGRMGAHGKCETLKIHISENKAVLKQFEKPQIADVTTEKGSAAAEIDKITVLCNKYINKKLTSIEKEWIRTWLDEYGMSEALIKRAFDDNLFRTHLAMKNIHDTLTKWNEHGIRTLEAAEKFCKEEHNANIRKAARKSSSSKTVWKTGAEAKTVWKTKAEAEIDITDNNTDKETQTTNENSISEDSGIPSDILDMFGESNEEIDEGVDL